MKVGSRIVMALSVLLIVLGGLAIVYLLDPSAFTFSQSTQAAGASVSSGSTFTHSQSTNASPVEIRSTATASYCNCTDTQTDDG